MDLLDRFMGKSAESPPDVKIGNSNTCLNNVHQIGKHSGRQSEHFYGGESVSESLIQKPGQPLPPVALCPTCHSDTIWLNAFGKARCYDCHPPKSPGLARSVLVASVSDSGEGEWVEWSKIRTRENGSQGHSGGREENCSDGDPATPRKIERVERAGEGSSQADHWPKRIATGLLQPSPLLPWVVDPAWRRAREEDLRTGSTDEELAGLIYGVEGEGEGKGGGGELADLPHILPDPRRTWCEPFLVEDFMPLVKDFTSKGEDNQDRLQSEMQPESGATQQTLSHPVRSAERSEALSNTNAQAAGPIAGGAGGIGCEALATTIATDANGGYWSQHPVVAGKWVRVKLAVARAMVEG